MNKTKVNLTLTVDGGSRRHIALRNLIRALHGGRKHIESVTVDSAFHPEMDGSYVAEFYAKDLSPTDKQKLHDLPMGWRDGCKKLELAQVLDWLNHASAGEVKVIGEEIAQYAANFFEEMGG
jgi:hypothetical protein